jgi:uncharacterized membrane protein YjjB (DUF3815 family)
LRFVPAFLFAVSLCLVLRSPHSPTFAVGFTQCTGAPKVVKGGLSKEEASKLKDVLEKAGAKVSIA